jgi:hypothetical protein
MSEQCESEHSRILFTHYMDKGLLIINVTLDSAVQYNSTTIMWWRNVIFRNIGNGYVYLPTV